MVAFLQNFLLPRTEEDVIALLNIQHLRKLARLSELYAISILLLGYAVVVYMMVKRDNYCLYDPISGMNRKFQRQ
ncbi:hypothetical protein LWI29_020030 [Acer saccharum]|uniref:Uncharacterized protein n=1 Tax=Acer saccharum TaxID=4024 RepID=A0AA39VZJ7_ACESA|nr:hypothetical protein LWI29_020030 [Acer saccharum]